MDNQNIIQLSIQKSSCNIVKRSKKRKCKLWEFIIEILPSDYFPALSVII